MICPVHDFLTARVSCKKEKKKKERKKVNNNNFSAPTDLKIR